MTIFLHRYIDNSSNENMCMFIYMYKKKVTKNIYACLIKLLATTKQFIRRNNVCCLKNQAIFFHRVSIEMARG